MATNVVMETVLMYGCLATALIHHLPDILTILCLVLSVGGWMVVVYWADEGTHPGYSPWTDFVRAVPSDLSVNAICSVLVPLSVILSAIKRADYEPPSDYASFLQSMAITQALGGALVTWMVATPVGGTDLPPGECGDKHNPKKSSCAVMAGKAVIWTLPIALVAVAVNTYVFNIGLTAGFTQASAIILQCIVQAYLPLWCPKNFTFGEAAILSQGFALFLACTACNIFQKFGLIFTNASNLPVSETNYYMEIAMLCCVIVATVVFFVPWCRTVLGFYVTFAVVMCVVALPCINLLLGEDVISWTLRYVTDSPWKKKLFIYWAECSFVAILIVMTFTGVASDLIHVLINFIMFKSRIGQRNKDRAPVAPTMQIRTVSGWIRKLFHGLAIVIFVPGIMKECIMMCVAGTCCLVVFIMMETMRLAQIPPLYRPLEQTFTVFLNHQDQGPVILTHVYLLVGCMVPIWFYPLLIAPSRIAVYSGIISLGVGDTAAALVGSAIGTHHWRGSMRTKEGTVAAILAQIVFVVLLDSWRAFVVPIKWYQTVLAIVLTSLVEAHTSHIDNLILPFVMYTLLL